mgnify:CR=1 FL=1
MGAKFDPNNIVIKLCMSGMSNLTRSYRSKEPLRIIGEVTEWAKFTNGERQEWRENLVKNKGEIIN